MAELYSSCILKGLSECGSYLPKREISLVKFYSLNDDDSADVAYFKIGVTQPYIGSNNILLEKGLTENRAKIQESRCKADSDICPKHRYSLVLLFIIIIYCLLFSITATLVVHLSKPCTVEQEQQQEESTATSSLHKISRKN